MFFRCRKGFTLIELVISFAFTSIIMLVLFSMLKTVLQYRRYSEFNRELQNTYFAIDYMQREFRQATEVRPISDFSISGSSDRKYLGFVVIRKILIAKPKEGESKSQQHYSVYYFKNGAIWRNATTKPSELSLEGLHEMGGFNLLSKNIASIDGTEFLKDLRLVRLRWIFEYQGIRRAIERDFFIRGDGL